MQDFIELIKDVEELKNHKENEEIVISIVSNIEFEPYFNMFLEKKFNVIDKHIKCEKIDPLELINNPEETEINGNIVIVILNYEYLLPDVVNDLTSHKKNAEEIKEMLFTMCSQLYNMIKNSTKALTIWFGFEDYGYQFRSIKGMISPSEFLVDKINILMLETLDKNDIYIDTKLLISTIGIDESFDNKSKYRWNVVYSRKMIEHIAQEVLKQYKIVNGMTKKCIVLDCDNVLWGGILSEDGIEKLQLSSTGIGRRYKEFQSFLLNLYYSGIILTVCSKNDKEDVIKLFNTHQDMKLKEEYISAFEVSWENKAEGIKSISNQLNIGLDSMIFIDDSIFEIELVKKVLPQVTTILYDGDDVYEQIGEYINISNKVDSNVVNERMSTYKTNVKRHELEKNSISYEEYLKSLDTRIDIHEATPVEYNRIVELSQRTNKMTNGKRYSIDKLQQLTKEKDFFMYAVNVSDCFSDLGLVGVMAIRGKCLDLFSLSCRVLGRNVEREMMDFIKQNHQIEEIFFNETTKNNQIKVLLDGCKEILIQGRLGIE